MDELATTAMSRAWFRTLLWRCFRNASPQKLPPGSFKGQQLYPSSRSRSWRQQYGSRDRATRPPVQTGSPAGQGLCARYKTADIKAAFNTGSEALKIRWHRATQQSRKTLRDTLFIPVNVSLGQRRKDFGDVAWDWEVIHKALRRMGFSTYIRQILLLYSEEGPCEDDQRILVTMEATCGVPQGFMLGPFP